MFPVGSLKKEEVRKIATEAGFKHVTQLKEVSRGRRGGGGFCFYYYCLFVCFVVVYRVWGYALLEKEIFNLF